MKVHAEPRVTNRASPTASIVSRLFASVPKRNTCASGARRAPLKTGRSPKLRADKH